MILNKKVRKSKFWVVITLMLLCCTLLAAPALAGQGNGSGSGSGSGTGSGNGSGGGQSEALALVSSVPADGQKEVPVNDTIKLTFNKNVVNLTVKENNISCFGVYTQDGTKVPVQVLMADDQVNPELNEIVSLKPQTSLNAATAYTIKIAPQLKAKNGMSLDKEVAVKFSTAAAATAPANTQPQSATSTEKASPANNSMYYLIGGALLIVLLAYYLIKRKGK